MKKTFISIAVSLATIFSLYNLHIANVDLGIGTISVEHNIALADDENPGGDYATKTVNTGNVFSTTELPDGSVCSSQYESNSVLCEGQGNIACKEEVHLVLVSTTCPH